MAMNPKDLLVWIKSLARGQALPLDASEVHESLKAAQDYAGTAIAYGGQTVKVKLDDGKYHEYILQPSEDGYRLEEIRGGGSAGIHVGDESSMPEGTVLHIDPDGEGYEIPEVDATLSKSGYAADANVTGKKIDELHERLDDVEQNGSGTSIDEIYILGEEETVDDAPDTAKEIIDPYDDSKSVDLGQFATKEDLRELSGEIGGLKNYVTPQMFGAIGDGVADDIDAVQAALDAGGIIYFPAGRYKVTRQLTVTNSCKIMMFKPYPSAPNSDYPVTAADNHMGARIETYATDGYGLLIGDGVEVDGLFMRAMSGFDGVLFKVDGTIGQRTYPSQIKLSHIRLDCGDYKTIPESMFDFVPANSYFGILDDISIGSLKIRQFFEYGFRSIMALNDSSWANSMRIRNLCIDGCADYPLYIDGGKRGCENWVFENLSIQAYPYDATSGGYHYKSGHIDIVTLKNVQNPLFLGCRLWDLYAASVTGEIFRLENAENIACFGGDSYFDEIDTNLSGKLQKAADHLNIHDLAMSVESIEETGANRLILSDGKYERYVDIPSVSVSDEQLDRGINNWFDTNARPSEQVGRNKFDPISSDTVSAHIYADGTESFQIGSTASNFISAEFEDVVRVSKNGSLMSTYQVVLYDADKNVLERQSWSDTADAHTISVEGTKYIRMVWTDSSFDFADRIRDRICVTVNDSLVDYEPYQTSLVGGIGSYVVLQAPNGAQYTIGVNNDGELIANAVSGGNDGSGGVDDSGELWNLSNKTSKPGTYYYRNTDRRVIENNIYVFGADRSGYWASNEPGILEVIDNDFSFTSVKNAFFSVPVTLNKGVEYNLTVTVDGTFSAALISYKSDGVYRSNMPIFNATEAGTYTTKFTPSDSDYYMLWMRKDATETEQTVTFTNISLTRADANIGV